MRYFLLKQALLFSLIFILFPSGNIAQEIYKVNSSALPCDFPSFTPSIHDHGCAPGRLFLNNRNETNYLLILNADGSPYFYRRAKEASWGLQPQQNNTISWYEGLNLNGFIVMDSSFTICDTIKAVNNYITDPHDLQILQNGGYLLIGHKYISVDMSQIVPGGNPDAVVVENCIQEFDPSGNLIFEWEGFDHIDIADAVYINLTSATIDYMHINSVAVDYDDNLLISSRHLCEVTKINRISGDIIWRLGGVNNQFTYLNDSLGFSFQHDARPVTGKPGYYTIFDNGNYNQPRESRVIELILDTLDMTVKKNWEYRHSPPIYSRKMCNAQRLPNGNTLVSYSMPDQPKAVEVNPEGDIIYEADFDFPTESYRAFKKECNFIAAAPYLIVEPYQDYLKLIYNKFGDTKVKGYSIFMGLTTSQMHFLLYTEEPYLEFSELINHKKYYFKVQSVHTDGSLSSFSNIADAFVKFQAPNENMILNGSFSQNLFFWNLDYSNGASASMQVNDLGELEVKIITPGNDLNNIVLIQNDITLEKGKKYKLEFDIRSEENRLANVKIQRNSTPYENFSQTGDIIVPSRGKNYQFEFEMGSNTLFTARLVFELGKYESAIYLDNVSLTEEIPPSSTFDSFREEIILKAGVYPNPFNESAMLSFILNKDSDVKVELFDILGRKIKNVIDRRMYSGPVNIPLELGHYSSGIYFYRLTADNYSLCDKIMYLK